MWRTSPRCGRRRGGASLPPITPRPSRRCIGIGRRFGAFFQRYDVLLSPVVAGPPVPLGTFDMMGKDLDAYFNKLFDYVCFTGQFNFSGGPAASVPFHWTGEGLPVGVQIGADLGNEAVLFRLASQIEAARPWSDKRPAM